MYLVAGIMVVYPFSVLYDVTDTDRQRYLICFGLLGHFLIELFTILRKREVREKHKNRISPARVIIGQMIKSAVLGAVLVMLYLRSGVFYNNRNWYVVTIGFAILYAATVAILSTMGNHRGAVSEFRNSGMSAVEYLIDHLSEVNEEDLDEYEDMLTPEEFDMLKARMKKLKGEDEESDSDSDEDKSSKIKADSAKNDSEKKESSEDENGQQRSDSSKDKDDK
ncbi:MAG: hypothetical protein J5379_00450 [Clostridiales bacterium]|nr:hypothetical protein [Clostridiales bacterium]